MTDKKDEKVEVSESKESIEDLEEKISLEKERIFKEQFDRMNEPAQTDMLKNLTFKTDLDRETFSRLPMSDRQKEQMLIYILENGDEL